MRGKGMTKERAIDLCRAIDQYLCAGNPIWNTAEIHDAMSMAIEALKEQRPLLEISKTVNREELENIMKNCPMMLITPDTEKIELIREQQWIPCSERLPNGGHNVLICRKDGTVGEGCYHSIIGEWSQFRWNVSGVKDVIAWLPLPEPFAEEKQ